MKKLAILAVWLHKGICMSGRFPKLVFAQAFALLVTASVCAQSVTAETDSQGKSCVQKVVNLFSVWQGDDASPPFFKEVARVIDYEEMSERALGTHWDKLSPTERNEFSSTFRRLIEERYYKRWHRIFNSAKLAYKSEVPLDGDLYIKTLMTVGKKQDSVVWRLSSRSGSYKIINIAVNQKDLLQRLSDRLDQRMRKDTFKGVLTWMREETSDDDDDTNRRSQSQSIDKLLVDARVGVQH